MLCLSGFRLAIIRSSKPSFIRWNSSLFTEELTMVYRWRKLLGGGGCRSFVAPAWEFQQQPFSKSKSNCSKVALGLMVSPGSLGVDGDASRASCGARTTRSFRKLSGSSD